MGNYFLPTLNRTLPYWVETKEKQKTTAYGTVQFPQTGSASVSEAFFLSYAFLMLLQAPYLRLSVEDSAYDALRYVQCLLKRELGSSFARFVLFLS